MASRAGTRTTRLSSWWPSLSRPSLGRGGQGSLDSDVHTLSLFPRATTRPLIIGPSTELEAPYPLQMEGKVIHSFGRGSKELHILPTANLPVDDNLTPWIADIKPGVYFGWASLRLPPSHPNHLHYQKPPRHARPRRRRTSGSAYIPW